MGNELKETCPIIIISLFQTTSARPSRIPARPGRERWTARTASLGITSVAEVLLRKPGVYIPIYSIAVLVLPRFPSLRLCRNSVLSFFFRGYTTVSILESRLLLSGRRGGFFLPHYLSNHLLHIFVLGA